MNAESGRMGETLREGLTILCGVLLALIANAWWSNHVDRGRERQYLDQLVTDLKLTETHLDEAVKEETATGEGIKGVLNAFNSGRPVSDDSVVHWFSMGILNYSDPRLVTGTVTALLQTGDLNLIRDARVRNGVSAYATSTAEDWAEFSRWVDISLNTAIVAEPLRKRPDARPQSFQDMIRLINTLHTDPEIRIALRLMGTATANRMGYLKHMRADTDSLLKVTQNAEKGRM